jgi:Na+/glutamate symporter
MQQYKSFNNSSPKNALKTITIIHAALLAGQLLFLVMTFVVITKPIGLDFANSNHDPQFYVALILGVVCLNVGTMIFKQQINRFNTEADQKRATLSEKMRAYQSALIVRYALLEGPSLFCIISFLTSGNLFYLIISGLLIIFMLMLRPTVQTAERNLQLTYEEMQELQ